MNNSLQKYNYHFSIISSITTYLTNPSLGVDVGAVAQQNTQNVRLIGSRRQVKRRLTADRGRVGIGAVLQKEQDDIHVSHERSHVQRRQTRLHHIITSLRTTHSLRQQILSPDVQSHPDFDGRPYNSKAEPLPTYFMAPYRNVGLRQNGKSSENIRTRNDWKLHSLWPHCRNPEEYTCRPYTGWK